MSRDFSLKEQLLNVKDEISKLNESWQKKERLRFIDAKLFWTGTIRREEISDTFQIHWTNASKDLGLYKKLADKNLTYDRKSKIYRATENFNSISKSHSVSNLLAYTNLGMPWHGYIPDIQYSVNIPIRQPNAVITKNILQCIYEKLAIEINYKSLNNPDGKIRFIYPNAVIFDGLRWHLRAFDEENNDYRDFVLSRVKSTGIKRERYKVAPDTEWGTLCCLKITPHSGLSSKQSKVIEFDYSMTDGMLKINTRKALAKYLIRILNLDTDLSPPRQQLECVNLDDFDF